MTVSAGNERLLAPASQREAGKPEAVQIDTRKLFAGCREILIIHGQEIYRLRLTRQNRLILTK